MARATRGVSCHLLENHKLCATCGKYGHQLGSEERKDMALKRMDNVLIVVDDLEAAKAFFIELGLKLEGETTVEGPSVGRLIGLKDVRATLAMLRTPDGQGGPDILEP